MTNDFQNAEYLIESISLGAYLKVTAVDPISGVEATVIGPTGSTNQKLLTSMAIKKLKRLLEKA